MLKNEIRGFPYYFVGRRKLAKGNEMLPRLQRELAFGLLVGSTTTQKIIIIPKCGSPRGKQGSGKKKLQQKMAKLMIWKKKHLCSTMYVPITKYKM